MDSYELEATNCSGNTKPSQSVVRPYGRHFQITLNQINKYDNLKEYIIHLKNNNYFISCKEIAPTTNHEHIHIYAQFDKPVRLGITKLCGAHVENCRGSPQQNVEYIKKDGNILDEIGTLKPVGNPTIRDIKSMTKDEIDELPWNMYNTAMKIKKEHTSIKISDIYKPNIKVIYLYGESGAGKTLSALKYLMEKYGDVEIDQVKHEGEFWLGVSENCKIALYDDFRDSHMKPSEFINFIDYNKHHLNVKGGSVLNNYELIIITSVMHPCNLYRNMYDDEPRFQWLRRIEKYKVIDQTWQLIE